MRWVKQHLTQAELETWLSKTAASDCAYTPATIHHLQDKSDLVLSLRDRAGHCRGYAFFRDHPKFGWTLLELGYDPSTEMVAVATLDDCLESAIDGPIRYKHGTGKSRYAEKSRLAWRLVA